MWLQKIAMKNINIDTIGIININNSASVSLFSPHWGISITSQSSFLERVDLVDARHFFISQLIQTGITQYLSNTSP